MSAYLANATTLPREYLPVSVWTSSIQLACIHTTCYSHFRHPRKTMGKSGTDPSLRISSLSPHRTCTRTNFSALLRHSLTAASTLSTSFPLTIPTTSTRKTLRSPGSLRSRYVIPLHTASQSNVHAQFAFGRSRTRATSRIEREVMRLSVCSTACAIATWREQEPSNARTSVWRCSSKVYPRSPVPS
jgi:hypothetical protein